MCYTVVNIIFNTFSSQSFLRGVNGRGGWYRSAKNETSLPFSQLRVFHTFNSPHDSCKIRLFQRYFYLQFYIKRGLYF